MKKLYKLTMLFIALTMSTSLIADGTQPPGSGIVGDPYQISTLDHLLWTSPNTTKWSKYYKQNVDIDAYTTSKWNSDGYWGYYGFSPICNNSSRFEVSYDGDGHTIDGIAKTISQDASIGVFSPNKGRGAMTLQFNTNLSAGTTITLPLYGTVNVTVDWGDGSNTDNYTTTGNKTHTYASEGTYTVSISGSLTQFGHGDNSYTNADKLVKVTSFGSIGLTSLSGAFYGTANLDEVPTILPSEITDLSNTFRGTGKESITWLNSWSVSSVTNMANMFRGANAFNQDISSWSVSSVTSMYFMFYHSDAFNQNIGGWDVSSVTNMRAMFLDASAFNQTLNSWVVSNVTTMAGMFGGASAFNQPLNNWDVSSVTDMSSMFSNASVYNQPLNNWDVSSVTDMSSMFSNASVYNQTLNSWVVSNVTTMAGMFGGASAFNQPLNNWDVSNVTNMSSMFNEASAFNQSLNNWDVSNVTNMSGMFWTASNFNQPLNNWDVSKVSTMAHMFRDASSFNQPLNNWNVSNVSNMYFMFLNVTLSTANYDALLIGWAALDLYNGVDFYGGNSTYSSGAAATARASIIADDYWSITDGGPAPYISWDGSFGSDWNTAANWSGNSVPTSTDNVIIPDVANDPVIDTYTNAVCNTLTLEPGATLTVSGDLVVGN